MIKTFSQKQFFQVGLLILFFVGGFVGVQADETTATDTETVTDNVCASALAAQSIIILDDYETFLDQYTKVNTPTSEQFENALMYYRYVEDNLRKLYNLNANISGFNKTSAFATQQLSSCRKVRDGIIEYARALLPISLSGSTTSKTTFQFVDGLKVMNEDLKDMSLLFQSTFPGQFTEMSNALPCYAHECLSK